MSTRIPARIQQILEEARKPFRLSPEHTPGWRESEHICALADSERHLGHAIREGTQWKAFDATHLNSSGDSFRVIGSFETLTAAKRAIEETVRLSWYWEVGGLHSSAKLPPPALRFEQKQ